MKASGESVGGYPLAGGTAAAKMAAKGIESWR